MFKSFLSIFFIFFIFSCTNLELDKIKCNGNNDKCPNNSICVENKCQLCPENSTKTEGICICEFENYIYDENSKKCIKRPRCESDADCTGNNQCAFALDPISSSVYLRCIPIGSLILNDVCSNTNNTCQNELSCLTNPENEENKVCTKACNLKNHADCANNEICIDYNIFISKISKDMVGMCINKNNTCSFQDDKLVECNLDCNSNNGACVRRTTDSEYGYCLSDQCSPNTPSLCPPNWTCTFTGLIYQCRADNDHGAEQGESCTKHSDCKTYLSCDNDTKKCRHYCRPDNGYAYNDGCTSPCDDIKDIQGFNAQFIDENVVGLCDYKQ